MELLIGAIVLLIYLYLQGARETQKRIIDILIEAIEVTDHKGQKRTVQIKAEKKEVSKNLDDILRKKGLKRP